MILPEYATCNTSYVWLKHMTKKNSLFLGSEKKRPAILSSGCPCMQLHIQVQLQPWQQANAKGIPGIWTSWKHSSNCVFLCVHMHKCVSSLNRSNMWVQLESRHLSYPLLRGCKFQSQKRNMNFSLFSWGAIELHEVKQKNSNVISLKPLIWSFLQP